MIAFNNFRIGYDGYDYLLNNDLQISNAKLQEARKELYGVDLMMVATGDLFATLENRTRDYRLVEGLLTYIQDITHRLMCVRGYHPEDPNVGVPWLNYLGKTMVMFEEFQAQLYFDIEEELYKDERTLSVNDIIIQYVDNTTFTVEISITPVLVEGDMLVTFDVAGRQ